MTQNLLETTSTSDDANTVPPEPADPIAPAGASDDVNSGAHAAAGTSPAPPPGLPEKFWDAELGELRVDSLVKSYQALEQKLGALAGHGVPDDPGGYDIKTEDGLFASDPEVNALLHAANFTQDQAQTVYDLAAEYLSPMVSEVAAEFQAQVDRLARHFGGEEKWRETAAQIKTWGRAKFPDEVSDALSGTYDGVMTLHKMMTEGTNEPGLTERAGSSTGSESEQGLQRMMQDPRYWRDHDPAFVERIRDGFKRLFPD
jgi:hypothetical protein